MTLPAARRTLTATSYADFVTKLQNAQAGDHIITPSGLLAGPDINVGVSGTAAAPIVVKAPTLLGTTIAFKQTVGGDHVWFHGLKLDEDPNSNRTGRIVIDGSFCRIIRCEFTRWWGDNSATQAGGPAHAVLTRAGQGLQIWYSYFHDPKPWSAAEIAADGRTASLRIFVRIGGGSNSTFHKNGLIKYCYFGSTIMRPRPGVYASQADLIEIGYNGSSYPQSDPQNPTAIAGWVVEDCIFDGTGRMGRPTGYSGTHTGNVDPNASGVVDVKISGVTFRRCHFTNIMYTGTQYTAQSGRVDLRFGAMSRVESCWFDRDAFLGCQGYGHLIAGNRFANSCEAWILTGSIEWDVYNGTAQQRSKNVKLVGNNGVVRVGRSFGATLEAQDTRIESHTGNIYVQQSYPGGWSQVQSGLRETGTTYAANPSQTFTAATSKALTSVGPYADL